MDSEEGLIVSRALTNLGSIVGWIVCLNVEEDFDVIT